MRAAGGSRVSTEGDATFFAFAEAPAAVRAAVEAQRRLESHPWPPGVTVRVRMGVHTGDARMMGSSYVGLDVHRVARIAAAGHGGQILVSSTTLALAERSLPEGVGLRDLGQHQLKDLDAREHLFQVVAPDLPSAFPPLRSIGGRPDHLPAQLTSFVGRDREKRELLDLLPRSRLLTLTGPGGTGKTRLSLEVAAAASDTFDEGAWFVPLAAITDPDLLVPTIAAAFGLRESPARPISRHVGRIPARPLGAHRARQLRAPDAGGPIGERPCRGGAARESTRLEPRATPNRRRAGDSRAAVGGSRPWH